ncbi:YkgJ family cysteine cluster protein [Dyella amyloliquefaciens]|uniref:YkgJ family cysteine cluster protein n=1 Tax=Dyella amyloliquefaciens TaxID=1770545 RepID=UPI00102ED1C4
MNSPTSPAKGAAHCSTCEAICCRLTVILQPEESIPDHLTTYSPEGLRIMKRGKDGWCVALSSTRMNCSIYETRPSVCRRFVMNGAYCKAVRADYRESIATGTRPEPVAQGLLAHDHAGEYTSHTQPLTILPRSTPLAKTNYSFEKRQREIAKKKKQDEKQAKKLATREDTKTESPAKASTATDA